MPRITRENQKTITNTYHIIIRGVNKQDIFFDEMDKNKFLNEIIKTKEKFEFEIYAYVLMSNHVHFTICDNNDYISKIMHRLCTTYAIYFNKKYGRVGHVFQDRFKSISVNTEAYLLDLVRYIHNNPQKAGICDFDKYKWSGYHDYYTADFNNKITDIDFILELFGSDKKKAIAKFEQFSKKTNVNFIDTSLEYDFSLSDEEAIELIKKLTSINDLSKVKNYNTNIRNKIIYEIAKIEGINLKQIARIMEMSERNVQRIVKDHRDKLKS